MSSRTASDQTKVTTKRSKKATRVKSSSPKEDTSKPKRNVNKELEETVSITDSEDVQSIQENNQEVSTPVCTDIQTSKTRNRKRSSGSTSSFAPEPDTIKEKLKMREKVSDKDVDLLMIGKTGNGKSALGNAILRRDIFESSGSTLSVTFKVDYDYAEFQDRIITVVDVPGVAENRLSSEKSTDHIMKSMEYAIKINPEGYHAFLLVVKYGNRLTDEESNAIKFLRTIFGEDFVKKFCIIIMTCGDNFERDNRKKNITFLEWCENEKGEFQELLKECSRRIILFDSVTENKDKQYKQVAQLLKTVDNLASSGKRYSDANFEAAKTARDKLMIESKEPMIRKETMRETSLILDKLSKIINYKDLNETMITLNALLDRATALFESTKKQDKGTGALHQLLITINDIINQIKKDIELVNTKAIYIEKNKEKERKHNIELQMIKEEAERKNKEEQIALEKAKRDIEEKRKKVEEDLKKQQEEQERKEEELQKEFSETKRIENELKKELVEAKRKEEEIEKNRLINETKQTNRNIELQKLKEEAERKITEEHIALEMANRENEEKRKKFEEDLKKRQEEQERKEEELKKEFAETKRREDELKKKLAEAKRKEEEIEEKQKQHNIEMQKLKEEAERKIAEEQVALEKANRENEEKRKKIEEEWKKLQEEQDKREETWAKEQEETKRKLKEEQEQENARRQIEFDNLVKNYKEVKSKSDEGLLTSLGQIIKLSAERVGEFLKEFVKYVMQKVITQSN
ncbi:unnamed protein product [Lymnaea stagnalis]|uniref:AIG1-type G domain-containing protein n=1 Tax=Lymnaea stagnalis TaxID=6523 RepID=A0AAV2HIX5_LYMST